MHNGIEFGKSRFGIALKLLSKKAGSIFISDESGTLEINYFVTFPFLSNIIKP